MREPKKGRCWSCGVGFKWRGAPRVKDACCPRCKAPLFRTTYLAQIKWFDLRTGRTLDEPLEVQS